jgi:hypothetical protein
MISIQKTLYLEPPFADAVSFVPVNLRAAHRSVHKSNGSIRFKFPPALAAVSFPESPQSPDAPSARDDLNVRDVSDDLEHPLSSLARVSVGANRHLERGRYALHVVSLRDLTTVVNVAQTD